MLNELPFYGIDDSTLEDCFNSNILSSKAIINDRLNDHGLKEYIFNLSKNQRINDCVSSYFTTEQFNNKFDAVKKDIEFSIIHLNIRSLNRNHSNFVAFMNMLHVDFDVIVLSEVWATNIEFYRNILDGFNFYWETPSYSAVGGIALLIKKSLSSKPRHDLYLSSSTNYKFENVWFEILKCGSKYIVGGIYRHPNQSVSDFCSLLEPKLCKLSKGKTPAFIAGDINVDLVKVDSNMVVASYLNNVLVYNFLPTVLLPTRITENSATIIDHIYYFEGNNFKHDFKLYSGNFYSDITDHLPIFTVLTKPHVPENINDRPLIRLHSPKNNAAFQHDLAAVDWTNILYNNSNVNDCYRLFITKLQQLYDLHFVLVRQSRKAFKDKKWMTRGIKVSVTYKHNLYKQWLDTRCLTIKTRYLNYKKACDKIINKAKLFIITINLTLKLTA